MEGLDSKGDPILWTANKVIQKLYTHLLCQESDKSMEIELDFEGTIIKGRLFETEIGQRLFRHLPVETNLQTWRDESYGSIGVDLGVENPIPEIPAGGIAYTNQGNYLCLFYGQQPAWPVEHVGEILDEAWQQLRALSPRSIRVTAANE